MPVAAIVQLIIAALGAVPLAAKTVVDIKTLLAKDPAVPSDLAEILTQTDLANADCIAAIAAWQAANPGV